ncbi:rod shape-determining protein MreC [Myxosarcina sp. GI1]|uniref:rod shape-determining protein MreC n=1 Tax=Myxosarcina sp. GI1 TaxID=1541065 RepID=UPI000566A519|nr:rod shape-determining protein MreC [Myxosarcina sp. GI1]
MYRWWSKNSFSATLTILALSTTIAIKETQGGTIAEAYYFLIRPFQSQQQLKIQNKLTNARILELEQRVLELERQNQNLKQLLDFSHSQDSAGITAPVIGRSADRWWNQVTLGKGSLDGIEQGYVVMGIGGVVGRVVFVTPHTSRVLLISDPSSGVGAVVSRNRKLGSIRGKDTQTVVMRFFTKVVDIKPGDSIATSPLSNLYPAGLPIGKVKSLNLESTPAPEAEIELSAPIDLLEWVTVIPFEAKPVEDESQSLSLKTK